MSPSLHCFQYYGELTVLDTRSVLLSGNSVICICCQYLRGCRNEWIVKNILIITQGLEFKTGMFLVCHTSTQKSTSHENLIRFPERVPFCVNQYDAAKSVIVSKLVITLPNPSFSQQFSDDNNMTVNG